MALSDVVINEIHYNPPDDDLESGAFREFVELYNQGSARIDLSGYYFDDGIRFTFPDNTWIEAGSYIVIAKDLSPRYWSNISFRIVGPYEGYLADGGERLTLKNPDGAVVESFQYSDDPPWPRAADGYDSSLERIAWNLPADDYHSWRSSFQSGGTPGALNSVNAIPPFPLICHYSFNPPHPSSSDEVVVQAALDSPETIQSVELRYEGFEEKQSSSTTLIPFNASWRYWKGDSSPSSDLDWTAQSFNDAAWQTGQAGFGYGDLDHVNTVLSDMRNRYTTLCIRQKFVANESVVNGAASLQIYYDDGFICYINGVEAARSNAPRTYAYNSIADAGHESSSLEEFPLPSGLFQRGENVIAVVGFNISLSRSSDFVLAPSLIYDPLGGEPQGRLAMSPIGQNGGMALYEAVIPPQPSQTLVRANIRATLTDGGRIILPHQIEPAPFLSYFVYDGEIDSLLPVLWRLPARESDLLTISREVSGVVCLPADQSTPDVFDGAMIIPSASNRQKVRFIKGSEFYGDRTINIIPEIPTGGTNAGISSPYREHLGFWFYKEMGVPSPWSTFYHIIDLPTSDGALHTQQLINQQINERFLEMNGRDPDADLYKLVYSNPNWEKHTNKAEGTGSIEDLLRALRTSNMQNRRQAMEERLELDEFLAYSAASIFTSNWDGYWNNNWMYLDPAAQKWEIYPWDLDWIWGATPPPNEGPMYWRMPLDFPIDGVADGDTRVSRAPGPVTSPMHQEPQFFQDYINKLGYEFNRGFARGKLFDKMDEMEALLLADLDLIQSRTGRNVASRKRQIQESYSTIQLYIDRRRDFLQSLLPVQVDDWPLY